MKPFLKIWMLPVLMMSIFCCNRDTIDCRTCGCADVVEAKGDLVVDSFNIFVPNVFTPNGDGINDLFIPFFEWDYVKNMEFTVTNRDKNKTYFTSYFDSATPATQWDGTYNGTKLGKQIYAWKLKGQLKWGKDVECNGEIFLNDECKYYNGVAKCRFSDQIDPKQGFIKPTSEPNCN